MAKEKTGYFALCNKIHLSLSKHYRKIVLSFMEDMSFDVFLSVEVQIQRLGHVELVYLSSTDWN